MLSEVWKIGLVYKVIESQDKNASGCEVLHVSVSAIIKIPNCINVKQYLPYNFPQILRKFLLPTRDLWLCGAHVNYGNKSDILKGDGFNMAASEVATMPNENNTED